MLGTVRGTFTLTTPSQQRNTVVQFHTKPKSRMKIHGGPGGIVQFKLSYIEVHVFIQTHNTIACSAAVIFTEGLLMGSVQNTNAPATPSDQHQTIMEVHAKSESIEHIVVQGEYDAKLDRLLARARAPDKGSGSSEGGGFTVHVLGDAILFATSL